MSTSVDNHNFFDNFGIMLKKKFDQKKFNISYNVSNVGVVDSVFADCEVFDIDSYYFTIRNNAFIGLFICVTTVNNKLCLNFNFASPVMGTKTALKLTDLTMKYLLENIDT